MGTRMPLLRRANRSRARPRSIRRAASVALALSAGCSDGGANPSPGFVQVASATAEPNVSQCGVLNPGVPYELTVQVVVVNTTANDVTVTSVSSTGVIVASADETELGEPAHVSASLPFEPALALVRAKDGNVTLTVTLTAPCGSGPSAPIGVVRYRDFYTTLYVTTVNGHFPTPVLTTRTNWQ